MVRAGGGHGRPGLCVVHAGHECGEVVGCDEGGWYGWPPVVDHAHVVERFRLPGRVVEDAVEVAVVLGEVSGGVFEVPEEVGADVMSAETPDVTFRVAFEHSVGAPT